MARFLALDWDHGQLHVVSATVGGGTVHVEKAAVWPESQVPNIAEAEALGKLLRDRLAQAGIKPAPLLACIGRDRLILKEIRYPAVAAHEEPTLVRIQVQKELTEPINEVVVDYAPTATTGAERRAIVPIARRELVDAYQGLCKSAGLKLAGLTPRLFGTSACLRRQMGTSVLTPAPEPADAPVAVVAAGQGWAEFCVVRGEQVLFARSMTVNDRLAAEVRRNLALYNGQAPQQQAGALYLGGAEGAALREKLQDSLGIPIYTYDPFGRAERADLPGAGRGGFASALGLLHLQANRTGLPVNFAKPKEPRPPEQINKQRAYLAAAAVAAVLLLLAGYGYLWIADLDRQIAALNQEKNELTPLLSQAEEDDKRMKAIGDWVDGEVVWLDELYDLTDRFPNITAVRLVSLTGDPLTRTAKSKYAGKMSLKGLATDDHRPLDELMAQLVKDGHYRVEPKVLGRNLSMDRFQFQQQFTTRADIEKQPPSKYVRKLPAPPEKTETATAPGGRGRGRFGDAGMIGGFEGLGGFGP